jgi:FtsX-like permease family
VKSATLRVALYRFRATFGRRWGGYLALALFVALIGGLAMGAVAGARRTQSSFPTFLATTDPADLQGITSFVNPMPGAAGLGYDPALMTKIAHIPHVTQFSYFAGLNIVPLGRRGAPESPPAYPAEAGEATGLGTTVVSKGGATVVQGRMINPRRADEFVVTAAIERIFGWHVGEVVQFGAYTNAQAAKSAFGTARVVPDKRFEARLVGVVVESQAVVEDQVDAPGNADLLLFTPTLTRSLLSCCTYYSGASVNVAGGSQNVPVVAKQIDRTIPAGFGPFSANPTAAIEAKAERAIKPESIALGVFGGIAALAVLLIAGQLIGRQFRFGANDLDSLRALGASPSMTMSDGLIGVVAAVVVGSVLAAGVAVGLSPLSPLGPVRPVYPTPGVAFDWTVLGFGLLFFVLTLSAMAVVLASRTAPHRAALRATRATEHRAGMASAAVSAGLPPTAVTGIRFALEPGGGRNAVPVRSAIVGAALALVVGVATVTFGSSLTTLVAHPALYGWNWSYELSAGQGGVVPGAQATKLLDRDTHVAAWSAVDFDTLRIDGQPVPAMAEKPGAAVAPPLLSGRRLEEGSQVLLGSITLAQLHKHVGDTVVVRNGTGAAAHLRIVGTATMPTIGVGGNQHLEMGTGALVADQVLPAHSSSGYQLAGAAPGPDAILVRMKVGDGAPGLASLRRIAHATSTPADYGVSVLPVQRPAEIVNYRSMGTTPAILGAGLALGAVVALGLILVASVRRRRRELALLKTLGFRARQLSSVVAWQATVAVVVGAVAGVPLGVLLGRTLWNLFAHDISVVPSPTVPVTIVVLIVIGAVALGNLVAALPGRMAARTPTALLLRAE